MTQTNKEENKWKTVELLINWKMILVETVEQAKLTGARSGYGAQRIFYMDQSGVRLKNIKITLKKGSVKLESGALYFMKGKIDVQTKAAKGFLKNLGSSMLSGEKLFKATYSGQGEIWLEPSFGHFMLLELDNDEIIVDKGMFYACESTLEVSAVIQKNISSAIFGGEGFFQTIIKGTGIAILSSPVPIEEVLVYHLEDEEVKVDGNFAILRRGAIEFKVEMITKGIIGSWASGEGLLQTFKGTGEVWLAPTQAIYDKLESGYGLNSINGAGSSNTHTK
ncbi:MAG: AIM24 family protein [Desulfobacteraceae bacterium]|nr:AIM24 family protein [Desulfobacteraceae bacterium]